MAIEQAEADKDRMPPQWAREAVLNAMNDEVSEEIVSMACALIDIASPTGEEQEVADYLARQFGALDMAVTLQEVEPTRNNMIAHLNPDSAGPSLMFNGHMDTST